MGKKRLTSMRIDEDLLKKAHDLGLNVSKVCENALKEMIKRLETPVAQKEPKDCPDNPQENGVVARGRFELPPAGPEPAILDH